MIKRFKYFIVDASALPKIIIKVAEAKRLLETGEALSVNEATQRMEISRSAFYKYKDAIRPFNDMLNGRIVNFQIMMKDEPGNLSLMLNHFARCGANILTINQNIPSGGIAVVNVGADASGVGMSMEEMLELIQSEKGVVRCEILAG